MVYCLWQVGPFNTTNVKAVYTFWSQSTNFCRSSHWECIQRDTKIKRMALCRNKFLLAWETANCVTLDIKKNLSNSALTSFLVLHTIAADESVWLSGRTRQVWITTFFLSPKHYYFHANNFKLESHRRSPVVVITKRIPQKESTG